MLVSKQALFQKLMKLSVKLWLLSAFGDQSRVPEGRKKKEKNLIGSCSTKVKENLYYNLILKFNFSLFYQLNYAFQHHKNL